MCPDKKSDCTFMQSDYQLNSLLNNSRCCSCVGVDDVVKYIRGIHVVGAVEIRIAMSSAIQPLLSASMYGDMS